jgi:hypothetical protein
LEIHRTKPGDNKAMLDETLAYVARSWATLPVRRRDKRPASELIHATRGQRGWKSLCSRPADADEVAAWLELDPGANIGVITGRPSGIAVVDVDDETRAPKLPATATVRTSRGRHLYFNADGPVPSRDYAWGEIRGEGRYVVAPASFHNDGHRYAWEIDPDGGLADFAAAGSFIRTTSFIRSTCPTLSPGEIAGQVDLERDEATALRLATALGVPEGVRIGEAFPCVLHPDGRPSAALWRLDSGSHVLYHDFHGARHGERNRLTLAQVRARLAGRTGPLGKPELSVWKLRLAWEAGLVEPLELQAAPRPPLRLCPAWDGFLQLLALRWLVSPGAPSPFSARFAAAWCGISKREAHTAVTELARLGLLRHVGFAPPRARLWLPDGVAPPNEPAHP